MNPSTLTIPCNAHRRCFFHAHHSGATSNQLPATLKKHGRTKKAANSPSGGTAKSHFQELPHELLLIVFENKGLRDVDLLSVALTCRAFFRILRPTTLVVASRLRLRRHPHTDGVNEFLRLLVRDLSDRYWHCEDCEILYPRSIPGAPAVQPARRFFDPRRLFPKRKQITAESTFRIRIAKSIIYALDFPTARAVVEKHRQASKGSCLNALKCGGAHIFQGSNAFETDDRILRYAFEPKIVQDKLLMRATYSWESNGPGELDGISTDRVRTRWQLEETGLWICAHLDIRAALEVAARHPVTKEEVRCDKCPTQYWVQRSPDDTVGCLALIQVWHNLGPCRRPEEERWAHMTSEGEKAVTYNWRNLSLSKGIYYVPDAFDWLSLGSRMASEHFQNTNAHRDGHIHPDRRRQDGHRRRKCLPVSVAEYM